MHTCMEHTKNSSSKEAQIIQSHKLSCSRLCITNLKFIQPLAYTPHGSAALSHFGLYIPRGNLLFSTTCKVVAKSSVCIENHGQPYGVGTLPRRYETLKASAPRVLSPMHQTCHRDTSLPLACFADAFSFSTLMKPFLLIA